MKGACWTQLKHKPSNSPVWDDLIKVKDLYLKGRVIVLGNSKSTDFWQDRWCGDVPLKEKFPDLFEKSFEQSKSVHDMAHNRWHLTFRRWLDELAQNQLRRLRDILGAYVLYNSEDDPNGVGKIWSLFCQVNVLPPLQLRGREPPQINLESQATIEN